MIKKQVTEAQRIFVFFKKNSRKLSARERDIVKSYYGFNGSFRHSLQDLGETYQVTRERIRQIKYEALNKIGYHQSLWKRKIH